MNEISLVDESREYDVRDAVKIFFEDSIGHDAKLGEHMNKKEKQYSYVMACNVVDLIKFGGASDVEEALKYTMIKTGLKLETGNDRTYRDWKNLLLCLKDYNGGKYTIPNGQELFSLLTENKTLETSETETRLTFARADLLFDHYVRAGSYDHVSIIKDGSAIRDYSEKNGEERSVRYEVLNGLSRVLIKPEKMLYTAMEAQGSYVYYHDPGHGWLGVPAGELKAMGLEERITTASYLYRDKAYLEEDDDAMTFLAIRELLPKPFIITNKYIENKCFIRKYPNYRSEGLMPEKSHLENDSIKKPKLKRKSEAELDFGR
jgi:hypothetical protein